MRRTWATLIPGVALLAMAGLMLADCLSAAEIPDDTTKIPSLSLPESSLLSREARAVLRRAQEPSKSDSSEMPCASIEQATAAQASLIHRCEADALHKSSFYQKLRDRYHVIWVPQSIAGVRTEVFTPVEGIKTENQRRVLINVHGGGFLGGWQTNSHLESIPIAALARIKIISVDYREAPEFAFPAASIDVAAVYKELLKTYRPESIGIYGCSAGGLLTAEAVAWLQKEKLPRPGAVGMFCEGADYWTEGDSGYVGKAMLGGIIWGEKIQNPYFKHAGPDDPLAFPVRSPEIMEKFPPSLLIAASRDPALSSVVYTHSVLVDQKVDAELHIWEGLGHAFFYDPDLPESRAAYAVIVKFFETHLKN